MFETPSLLTTITSFLIVIRLLNRLSYRFCEVIFFGSYGLIFGLAPLMQSFHSPVHRFGDEARGEAAWFAFLGLLMLFVGFLFANQPDKTTKIKRDKLLVFLQSLRGQKFLKLLFWSTACVAIFAQFLTMYIKGISIGDLINGGRFEFRFRNTGYLTVMASHLTSCLYVPAFAGVFLSRKYQKITILYMALMSVLFFFVFSKGTRSIPLAMVVSYIVALCIRYPISWRQATKFLLIGCCCLMISIGVYELRRFQKSTDLFHGIEQLVSFDTYEGVWDRDPLGYSTNLVGAVSTFPRFYPFLNGASYRRMLVFYLSEAQFPDWKPPDTNIQFGLMVHNRNEALKVTCPPSILGDVWINFWGWPGLLVLVVHGILYANMFNKMQSTLFGFMWLGPLSGRFLVLVQRGEPYENFMLFLLFMFQILFLMGLCLWFTSPKKERWSVNAYHLFGLST